MWLTIDVMWSPLWGVDRTRDATPSEQPPLGNARPSLVAEQSSLNDFNPISLQLWWTGLEIGISGRPSQASLRLPGNTTNQVNGCPTRS